MIKSLNRLLDNVVKPIMKKAASLRDRSAAIESLLVCEKLLKDWELEQERVGNILNFDANAKTLYWSSRRIIGKAIEKIRG